MESSNVMAGCAEFHLWLKQRSHARSTHRPAIFAYSCMDCVLQFAAPRHQYQSHSGSVLEGLLYEYELRNIHVKLRLQLCAASTVRVFCCCFQLHETCQSKHDTLQCPSTGTCEMQISLVNPSALIFSWLSQHDCAKHVVGRAVACHQDVQELAVVLSMTLVRVR